MEKQMFYELIINNDALEPDALDVIQKALVAIGNDNIDEEAKERHFTVNGTRIVLSKGVWGLERGEEDDVKTLSAKFPSLNFIFTKTWEVKSSLKLEELKNFTRQEFIAGKMTRTFNPKPITWVEESTGSDDWFN